MEREEILAVVERKLKEATDEPEVTLAEILERIEDSDYLAACYLVEAIEGSVREICRRPLAFESFVHRGEFGEVLGEFTFVGVDLLTERCFTLARSSFPGGETVGFFAEIRHEDDVVRVVRCLVQAAETCAAISEELKGVGS